MKPKTVTILVVLLAACVLYVVVRQTDIFKPKPPATAPAAVANVFEPPLKDISKITITAAGEAPIVLAKEGQQWRIVQPVAAKASELRVNELIGKIENLKSTRSFTPSDKEAASPSDQKTGLDKPQWTLTVVDSKGASHTLKIGKSVPSIGVSGQVYIRPDNDPRTYVTSTDFSSSILPARDYRDNTVLSLNKDEIVRVAVEGSKSFEIQKRDGQWSVVKPFSARADADKVSGLLNKLSRVTADSFVADNPANLKPYELDPSNVSLQVRVWTQGPTPATTPTQPTTSAPAPVEYDLAIGKLFGDKAYAKLAGDPAVFLVEKSLREDFQPKPADIRDRKVLAFTSSDVTAVDIKQGDSVASLASKDGKWVMTAPVTGEANSEAVSRLLSAMSGLQADSFPETGQPPAAYGLDKPRATITLHLLGKAETIGLVLGGTSKTGEMSFVSPVSSTAVAVVRSADLEPLLAEPAAYYTPTMFRLDSKSGVTAMTVARKGETLLLSKDDKGDWKLTAPQPGPADNPSVDRILSEMTSLTAMKIVSVGTAVPAKYTGAEDQATVTLIVSTPPKPASAPTTAASGPASAPATGVTGVEKAIELATRAATQLTTKPSIVAGAATLPSTGPVEPVIAVEPVRHVIHVAKIGASAYVWIDGLANSPVGEFPASLYETLWVELSSREVWKVKAEDVTGIKLSGTTSLELQREGDKWSLVGDEYVKIDTAKVTAYLGDLAALKAERFLSHKSADAAKYGLDKPALTVELTTAKGVLKLSVAKGDEKSTVRPAMTTATEGVFELTSATADRLAKTWKDFQAPKESPSPSPTPYSPPPYTPPE
ncbi:MAG: DUF4340 domain-containing protein [Phycisphaerae bacterium]